MEIRQDHTKTLPSYCLHPTLQNGLLEDASSLLSLGITAELCQKYSQKQGFSARRVSGRKFGVRKKVGQRASKAGGVGLELVSRSDFQWVQGTSRPGQQ